MTRRGCHLCEEVEALLGDLGVDHVLLDVDADNERFELYHWRVPVLLVDGEVRAEGRIGRRELASVLRPQEPGSRSTSPG